MEKVGTLFYQDRDRLIIGTFEGLDTYMKKRAHDNPVPLNLANALQVRYTVRQFRRSRVRCLQGLLRGVPDQVLFGNGGASSYSRERAREARREFGGELAEASTTFSTGKLR